LEKPLVDKKYLLEKFPGKGGWTFTVISEIPPDKKAWFGWVKVKGTIDDFEIKKYRLMSMKNGKLFLPVRAEIRKKIGKQEGDWVHVTLFADNDPIDVPKDLMLCLEDEPEALKNFLSFSESEQQGYIDWIYAAKKEETKVERIAETVNKALKNLKLRD